MQRQQNTATKRCDSQLHRCSSVPQDLSGEDLNKGALYGDTVEEVHDRALVGGPARLIGRYGSVCRPTLCQR